MVALVFGHQAVEAQKISEAAVGGLGKAGRDGIQAEGLPAGLGPSSGGGTAPIADSFGADSMGKVSLAADRLGRGVWGSWPHRVFCWGSWLGVRARERPGR